MEEILHHLGCIKPCKYWDKLPINWCMILSINSKSLGSCNTLSFSKGSLRSQLETVSQATKTNESKQIPLFGALFGKKRGKTGCFQNRGTPKWMVKIMENPIKTDDLGVPLFSETSIWKTGEEKLGKPN